MCDVVVQVSVRLTTYPCTLLRGRYHATGNVAHAAKSAEIMDAWSAVLVKHNNSNGPLQSAWAGAVFPRAAEVIRHTWDGWPAANVARFEHMLKTACDMRPTAACEHLNTRVNSFFWFDGCSADFSGALRVCHYERFLANIIAIFIHLGLLF